jgi:hypothetical protein
MGEKRSPMKISLHLFLPILLGKKLIVFIILLGLNHCVLFKSSVKIKPIPFDYRAIGNNYFNPQNDKPFPLTIQRGNNLYNSTSKDGKYLFYATDKDGNFDIWFRDLNSSIVVPVTQHPSQEYKPAISPDGKKLVFVSEQFDSEGDLVLLNMEPEEWVQSAIRGKRFINQNFRVITNPDWKNQNSQQRVIDTDPAWMPDGERIVFSSDRFSPGIQNLVLLDIKSNKMTSLTSQGGTSPFVSVDGNTIYFLSYRDSEYGEIYSLELRSGNVSRITKNNSLDFSPSVSKDNQYLYYTSIREDTNGNGILDERDKSYIVQRDLLTNKEKYLTSGDSSVFDTKYSEFNGGSILFSASLYNSINIYFIPYSGSVPLQEGIVEQFNFALEYINQDNQARYFLALDSVALFFDKDPLYSIYHTRVQSKKIEYLLSKNKTKEATKLILELKKQDNPMSKAYSYLFDGKTKPGSDRNTGKLLTELSIEVGNDEQLNASILHLRSEWEETTGRIKEVISTLESIQLKYPKYHLIRDVRNKYGYFEFKPDSIIIPKFYVESILHYEELMNQESEIIATRKHEVNDILQDIHKKILDGKTQEDIYNHTIKIQNHESNPKNSVIINQFLEYIKAENLRNRRNLNESISLLDKLIPIPENLELYPLGQKSIFETDYYIRLYRNPALSYIHFLKYKNSQDLGDNSTALRHLQIFMEFYDPITSPDIKSDELTYLFLYWENKAIEYERMGDLQQAAFHYYFNNLGMALAKSKNLSEEKFYGNYAVYYQRKMIDTIFQYGRSLREKEEAQILNRINILGEDNLDILGNLSDLMAFVQSIPLLDALKVLGDFRDLRKKDVIHENALQLSDLYFNYHLEKNRPYLNLAVAYGHAYYLINRSVINETALYERGEMTEAKKLEILENYKKAEYELRWILFSDPTFPDAYQLLGWLLQYVDIIKAKRIESKSTTEEERYDSAYQRYFPDKNFEENVELYAQILEFLGKEYPNKKILSDINLNMGNNYFLLSNYPRSNESGEAVEKYGKFIVSKAQFDDYRQEAVFHYNYGRSSLYRGNYEKAIEQFETTLNIYTKNEYYQSLRRVGHSKDSNKSIDLATNAEFIEVKGKLALINAMIALCYMEMGRFEESIPPIQQALSHNRISKNLNELNLWNSLAISYQKTGRFKESESILNRAQDSFMEESQSIQGWSFSIADKFWAILLPDNIRVMGDGRFPGEFPLPFKKLLTQSIEINNHIEKKDYKKALEAIDKRDDYISSKNLKKWVMGNLVTQKTFALRGQIYYDSGDYYNAYKEFQKMADAFQNTNELTLERSALIRKSNSVFAYSENRQQNQRSNEKWKMLLNDNFQSLVLHRDRSIRNCETNMDYSLCRDKFRKDFLRFDIALGLNYFYLGEFHKSYGDFHAAFLNYGMALSLLENPGNIDPNLKLLTKDPLPRRMRIRNMLNVARIHIRLGDLRKANSYLKEATEYAYEFRMERELFVADLVKLELTSFGGYQPNSPKSKNIETILSQLNDRLSNEESIFWELPAHILDEVNRSAIEFSIQSNRPWQAPPIRDIHRQRRIQKDVIQSSLEYTNLELDKATKDYSNILKSILSKQRDIENRAIGRSKIGNLLKEKESLRNSLVKQSNIINKIDKKYSLYYSPINYSPSSLNTEDSYIRCYDNGENYAIWKINSKSRDFSLHPRSSRGELVESLIRKNDKNLFLNPDNCNFLYRHSFSKSSGKIQLITKDSDAHRSKIRDGIDWRWRTVLVADSKQEDESRLKFSNSENLDYRLLDTDVLFVTNSLLEDRFPVFTYKGLSSLNLRELFTGKSEIATIVLEVEDLGRWDWENINKTWDLARTGRDKNLIITKKLTNQERRLLKRNQLPEESLVFGILPNKINPANPLSRYRELRSAAVFEERAKNFNSAYDLYYDAGSFLANESNEILENDIDLARIKRKIFPNKDPDYFYKPLFREYKNDELSLNIIYTKFLIDCFADRTIETNRAQCELYYYEWMGKTGNKNTPVRFFYKMYRGHTRDILNDLNLALEYKGIDEYIKKMHISDLFLENFLFKESLYFANLAGSITVSPREKSIVEGRRLEIQFHKAYLLGETDFTYRKINAGTTYALGYNREWDAYLARVYSPTFRRLGESDNIFEDNRKRMYQKWRDWEFGEEFESSALIPDELYGGGSVLSKYTHLNRSLYFYLILESSKHQINNESDSLIDMLIEQEQREGFYSRAFSYALHYADQLMRNGHMERSIKYIQYFETRYNAQLESHPLLESKYSYLIMKLSRYNDRIVFFEDSVNLLKDDDKEVYDLFLKMEKEGIESFASVLNEWVHSSRKNNQPFTPRSRRKAQDLIQYMKRLSLSYDSTEGFLDAIHFEQTLNAYNEQTIGRKPYFKDLPIFDSIHKKLAKAIPKDQELSIVNDYLQKTYLIQVIDGKTKGRELFTETSNIKLNLRRFHQSAYEGGSESRIREILEDRYRNSLRLNKDKLHYIYLTGYHIGIPFLQKSDGKIFQIQNLSSLISNSPIRYNSLDWNETNILTKKETSFNPLWFKNLKSIENWELNSIQTKSGNRVTISQEELRVNEKGTIVFGGIPISQVKSKTSRNSVWMLSSNQLGYPYLLSNNLNNSLFHLDKIHNGVGVVSIDDQSDFNNTYFMKSMLVDKKSNTDIRFRFIDARDKTKNRYLFDRYWTGYRVYTSSVILP